MRHPASDAFVGAQHVAPHLGTIATAATAMFSANADDASHLVGAQQAVPALRNPGITLPAIPNRSCA
jgi:hypothetical protein